ncbi:MAG TPA: hypothetical protein VIF09_09735 [Polyangiaceae bacterium]|jgi:hypothetical protein
MRWALLLGLTFATAWGCGGQTFTGGNGGDGGTGSSSGSTSGSSGSSGASSSGGGSSSGSGSSSSGGTSSSSSGSSSGASSGGGPLCPPNPPTGGTGCPQIGLRCEYGSNPNPNCNEIETCESTGWSYPTPGPACITGQCPASYADAKAQATCTQVGTDCAYPQGQCNCSYGPLPGTGNTASWYCETPPGGCPEPRPDLGTSCTQEGLTCDYGACYGGIAVACQDGIWTEGGVACPAVASP